MPYEQHPVFEGPKDTERIWRYMTLEKFTWMVLTSKLHFHRIGAFDDPFEGTIPRGMKQLRDRGLLEADPEMGDWLVETMEESTKFSNLSTFVNSWHRNDIEDAAMWKLYGRENKSIAIRSTVGGLINAIEPIDYSIYISPVRYVDYYADWEELSKDDKIKIKRVLEDSGLNSLQSSIFKRSEFSYEDEIRAVFSDISNADPSPPFQINEVDPEAKCDYFNLTADIDSMIDKVIYASQAPKWFKETLHKVVDRSPLDLTAKDIEKSEMDQDPLY